MSAGQLLFVARGRLITQQSLWCAAICGAALLHHMFCLLLITFLISNRLKIVQPRVCHVRYHFLIALNGSAL